ncbi:MAG: putative ABC transport system permease protein [Cognaticolwellia sp.]|jgi:putative ABC transport system permease protein
MLLSLLLLALGTGLISILLLITTQIEDKFDKNQAGVDLIIGAKGSPLQLVLSSMYHIDNPTGNINLNEFNTMMGTHLGRQYIKQAIPISAGDSHKGHRIIGTTHAYPTLYKGKLAEGKLWSKKFEVTIGSVVAERLEMKIGDTFFSAHGVGGEGDMHKDKPMIIVGILEPTGSVIDQLLMTGTETVWGVHEEEGMPLDSANREVTAMLIFCRNKFGVLTIPQFVNKKTKMMAASPAMETARLYELTGNGVDVLRILAIIIIIVSGLSIFISLFNSLKERQYELALMRVMGATPIRLFFLVILEGIILAILGYIIGIGLSHLAMFLLETSLEESYQYDFSSTLFLTEEWYLLAGALTLGFIAALIPAIRASRTDISTTLTTNR